VEPDINSVEVHPQLSHNGHPVDGWCAGGCWFTVANKFEPPFLYTYYLKASNNNNNKKKKKF
jgi:hypothetical protein